MTQSLPSRRNQDEFSKSNTVLQSAETVVQEWQWQNGSPIWQNTFYWKTKQECGEYFKK